MTFKSLLPDLSGCHSFAHFAMSRWHSGASTPGPTIGRLLLAIFLTFTLFQTSGAVPQHGIRNSHHRHHHPRNFVPKVAEPTCRKAPDTPFDFSVKLRRHEELPICPKKKQSVASPQHVSVSRSGDAPSLFKRDDAPGHEDYTCSEHKPCSNGACCSKLTGYCNYGEAACGTSGISPNEVCWSNCHAKAECGINSDPPGKKCPLNVCCSEFGFCGMTADFCNKSNEEGKGCQSNCDQPPSGGKPTNVQNRVIGYYEAWLHNKGCAGMNFDQIPVGSLDYLFFSFGYITPGPAFDIVPMDDLDPELFLKLTEVKRRNSKLKAMVALGGWTYNDNHTITQPVFSDMVRTPQNRAKFISNIIRFMRHYAFDGVDFDWEYPGAGDRGGNPNDGINFTSLLKELRAALDKEPRPNKDDKYVTSFTVPSSYWYLRHFDLKAADHVDFVNVMTYDLHGEWNKHNHLGKIVRPHTNWTEITTALDLLWRNNIKPAKLNLGIGFYGRSFQLADQRCNKPGCAFLGGALGGPCSANSGTLTFREITDIIKQHKLEKNIVHDKTAAVKWISWDHDQWVSYDDGDTIKQKMERANKLGIGGLLIWAIDQDTDNNDALAAIVAPEKVSTSSSKGDDDAFWKKATVNQDCKLMPEKTYQDKDFRKCDAGYAWMTEVFCGPYMARGYCRRAYCCPVSAAPDPKNCQWRGNPDACNGQCHGGEMTMFQDKQGSEGGYCSLGGNKAYCCKIPSLVANLDKCYWHPVYTIYENCKNKDDVKMTWTREDHPYFPTLYCCPKKVADQFKDCHWEGEGGKCSRNTCAYKEVQLLTKGDGEGTSCWPWARKRAFCCTPKSEKSPFDGSGLDIPLSHLFPEPPTGDLIDVKHSLITDHSYGREKPTTKETNSPNEEPFQFYVLASPKAIQTTLRKRDGSDWDVYNCKDTVSEGEHTVNMVCTNPGEDGNCNDIHLGPGAVGTIVELPDECGPGRYAVVKDLKPARNQTLPPHLNKRDFGGEEPVVQELTFDYNFRRVPRDYGDTQLRLDFSNRKGYWDEVVKAAASGSKKRRKRSLDEFDGNHKRWLEEEWRDDMHFGAHEPEDLHKRWFGEEAVQWLQKLTDVKMNAESHHNLETSANVILFDETWECKLGDADVLGKFRSSVGLNVNADVSFGVTIISKFPFDDLSNSYVYYKTKGDITAHFMAEAFGQIRYDTKEKEVLNLDTFPGATFKIPGIVTIGPAFKLFMKGELQVQASAELDVSMVIAEWDVRQVFPEHSDYKPDHIDKHKTKRSAELFPEKLPTWDLSVRADGHIKATMMPTFQFGIDFHGFDIGKATIDLVAEGSVTIHANAQYSNAKDGPCPFEYGIDAAVGLRAEAHAPNPFKWQKFSMDIMKEHAVEVIPTRCIGEQNNVLRRDLGLLTLPMNASLAESYDVDLLGSSSANSKRLQKRMQTYGPLFNIPPLDCGCDEKGGVGGSLCNLKNGIYPDLEPEPEILARSLSDDIFIEEEHYQDLERRADESALSSGRKISNICNAGTSYGFTTRQYPSSTGLQLIHNNPGNTHKVKTYDYTPAPAPAVGDDTMDTSSLRRRRRSLFIRDGDDTDMPDAPPARCPILHWETNWVDMPTGNIGGKNPSHAAEHALEIALLKEFFAELSENDGKKYPNYKQDVAKPDEDKVTTCQMVKTYFKDRPARWRLRPDWMIAERQFFDHFGGLWPGTIYLNPNEAFDLSKMFLLPSHANKLKMGMLQKSAMANGGSDSTIESTVSSSMEKAFANLKGALLAWNYMREKDVKDSYKWTADLIGLMLDHLEDKLVARKFGTNPVFKDDKLRDYKKMNLKDSWTKFAKGRYVKAGTKGKEYINGYLKAVKAMIDKVPVKDRDEDEKAWAESYEAFKKAWDKVKDSWSFSYTAGESGATIANMPTDQ